ncbi:MAG: LuxR C-terminal-related transcriptional regulator [Treponema sp.]|jgi:LuxR family maltose regulon positive regulatory protein|nr:LuxR C-terminal-related transcriptional regulator [Treponema sp.]
MEETVKAHNEKRTSFHFERPRLSQLFTEAVKHPLVVICAGAGYGKTSAVHDFTQEYQAATTWVQLSERDNAGARFWENYTHSMAQADTPLSKEMARLGFPDTKEKLKHYRAMLHDLAELKKRIIVMDDFHNIEEPFVLGFIEECIFNNIPPDTSVFLLSRNTYNIKIQDNVYEKKVFNIGEDDLRFTESELAQYFRSRGISPPYESLREIIQDTEGWAFAINFIAKVYQNAPGYSGYVRNALRTNVFNIIETGFWNDASERLQNFLLRLSLIEHLSVDLLTQLTGGDAALLADFEAVNACVRRDSYINAYLIHPLFLEFLRTKQESITEEEKRETYTIAGDWCALNGFKIDAMSYYEKTGNYQPIVSILDELPSQIPHNIAQYAAAILDRAPAQAFDKVEFLAEMHIRTYMGQALWQKSLELVKYYEAKFLEMPDDDDAKNRILARIYNCWAYLRGIMSVTDDIFDFDIYTEKACKCISVSVDPGEFGPYWGAWINCAGSSKKGVPEEFIAAIIRNQVHLSQGYAKGFMAGEVELAQGELEFYRGNIAAAESLVTLALKKASVGRQFRFIHKALFYTIRIAVSQGNFEMAEQALKDSKARLEEAEYVSRFIHYDISLSWYYCFLGFPEKIVDWLKEDFSPYVHAGFIENFGNQIKARYCYVARNFPPLLSYIEEMKQRESYLFGRIEMLAMEACVFNQMKDKKRAFSAFEEAYKTASPNEVVMPFIEMGKDMRTLTAAMLKESGKVIPAPWLEDINHKSATYAKRRSHIIAKYMQTSGIKDNIVMSPRETEILTDISHGLSRSEIADSRNLSANTVKMVINNIHYKLGAENLADLIRIAVEKKLI